MGLFDRLRQRRAAHSGGHSARFVTVESPFNEDEKETLEDAARIVDTATMRALQKQIRSAGFKRALVHGIGGADGDGFIVVYEGREYRFNIVEVLR